MSDMRGRPLASEAPETEAARWRQEHEVRALLDTLSIYRRCVVDLAAENMTLRDEVAVLRAIRPAR